MNCCENPSVKVPDGCCCHLDRCPGMVTQNPGFHCHYVCGCDGCGWFDPRCRDPFWPHFSHPRWLCLEQLYACREHDCPRCC